MVSLVVAMGDNRVIGKDGWMPWNLPEDLKVFRSITLDHNIVMGRTTFDSMKKPLPRRHTYVVTRNTEYTYDHEAVTITHDLKALLETFKNNEDVIYVAGGAQIYTEALPYVDEMWISLVDEHYEGDTFFPAFDPNDFIVVTKEKKEGFTLIHYRKK
ncbi:MULTISPECIES: dihydrofolate reductase [Breznakia]|uniref:Dihydrofolate reductase n=1 Tax=Breznakia blatticola TaxID=1754012 RepID=A0A4R8A7F9_9FIRM|nr:MULTISPECIES: dihydrofolate reductase [Breznakia]MDH6366328.1 dihydrofolate reductase [Breznakia sp. PH1-1]MDH6403421.1 dihydrofolate reductase [Breznakia sp. PF1-11]MDH6411130.1 dihydrofolate reductase [Breznakia sp. PFB1-11]MDH6413607.1 dihydrofolate reductase [Breznakia sp. PFB1-14]MDH6415675.1 dihydrofolate reductase [Breznakia sp. PFB1-4]